MSIEQWVILELSSKADGEDPDLVRRSIVYAIKGADVFIPAAVTQKGEDRVIHYLVEGYAFIRHVHTDQQYGRLENSKYVQSVVTKVLRTSNGRPVREFATISTKDVEKMKRQIHAETDQGIGEGDLVLITSGAYKQIQARVIEDIPENDTVQVHVLLRSKDTIVSLPRSFLRLVQKAPKPPAVDRFASLKEWFNDSYEMILSHTIPLPNWGAVSTRADSLQNTERRVSQFETLSVLTGSFLKGLSLDPIRKQWDKLRRLLDFTGPWDELVPLVRGTAQDPNFKPVNDQYLRFMTVMSFLDQLEYIGEELQSLEDQIGDSK